MSSAAMQGCASAAQWIGLAVFTVLGIAGVAVGFAMWIGRDEARYFARRDVTPRERWEPSTGDDINAAVAQNAPRVEPAPANLWAPHSGYAEALMAGIRDGTIVDPDFWLNPETGQVEKRLVRLSKDELDGEREYRARLLRRRLPARQVEQARARREGAQSAEPAERGPS